MMSVFSLYNAVGVAVLSVAIYFVTSSFVLPFFRPPARVEGYFAWEFKSVAELFRKNLERGVDYGGSFSAYVGGEQVIDIWGGFSDIELQHYWRNYTTTSAASVTKLVASVTFATLVEKGYVKYDEPVSKHWPEFAQNNKDDVTVRMLLSHQAGVVGLDPQITPMMILNEWNTVEEILARQKPLFTPGSGFAYHAYTFGLYIDALARKVDPKHRRVYQIFKEDIGEPFGIDFTIGAPKAEQYRIARESRSCFIKQLWDALLSRDYRSLVLSYIFKQNPLLEANDVSIKDADKPGKWDDPDSREIPYCSGQGFGSASSLAKLLGILANGGRHEGKQLLKSETIDDLSKMAVTGYDMALKRFGKRGAGVWIVNNSKGEEVFGHPGFGGQMAHVDRQNKVGLAYVTNHLSVFALGDDPRFKSLERTFYECLEKYITSKNYGKKKQM